MELTGSFCYEGRKGDKKATYKVRFKDVVEAKAHILATVGDEELVKHFWYGYHINGLNKLAGKEGNAENAYAQAELILSEDFPTATFVRGVEKVRVIDPKLKELEKLMKGKGLSIAQVEEMIDALTSK